MRYAFVTPRTHDRLLLVFAGWAMDGNPFAGTCPAGYDMMVTYDYTSEGNIRELVDYQEICIVAWSFGVIEAHRFITANPGLPITMKVAVNGTLHPVDDRHGIPEAIFRATLQGLTPASLAKFHRRMCGSADATKLFLSHGPQRDFNGLADELRHIASLPQPEGEERVWDTVIIADRDMIIPTANQQTAWAGHPHTVTISGAHLPDFGRLFGKLLSPKPLVTERFSSAMERYDDNAVVQRHVALRLAKLWNERSPIARARNILEVGAGSGLLTLAYAPMASDAEITLRDLAPMPDSLPGRHEICDAETAIRRDAPANFDAIVSASALQWFNSPATFTRHCLRILADGGILAFATYAADNFPELRDFVTPPPGSLSAEAWRAVFDNPGVRTDIISESHTLTFSSPAELLRHLRLTGVNATATPHGIRAARAIMESGITRLTYSPLYILATK